MLWKEAAGTLHPAGPANDNKEVSDDARLILNLIRDYPGVTRMQIAENVAIDRFDFAMTMKQLMKQSAVIRIVSAYDPHFWVRYYPAPRNSV